MGGGKGVYFCCVCICDVGSEEEEEKEGNGSTHLPVSNSDNSPPLTHASRFSGSCW